MAKRWLMLLGVVLPIGASWAQAKDAKDPKPTGSVNWQGQVIRAKGAGAPDVKAQNPAQARLGAERAALIDAFRNLLAQVKGVSVDGARKMDDLMQKDEIRARVEGVVKGYKVVDKRYFSDNGVEIDIEVPMVALTDVIDPDAVQVPPPGKNDGDASATGLVIDARGLRVTPALMPRVLDDSGKAVYSIDSLTQDARKVAAVASYVQSLEDAKKSLRAGEKPMIVKAEKSAGADLQLRTDDVKKLASLNTSFLADGKVVIVLN
jgi:hypothetical protein